MRRPHDFRSEGAQAKWHDEKKTAGSVFAVSGVSESWIVLWSALSRDGLDVVRVDEVGP